MVVLDDVHWADGATLELLDSPAAPPAADARPASCSCYRGRQVSERLVPAALGAAAREGLPVEVRKLAPLTRRRDPSGCWPTAGWIPGRFGKFHRRSGGNPFYAEQLAPRSRARRPAATGRFPRPRRARPRRTGGTRSTAQVERLGAGAIGLLRGAAVAGDPFEVDLAAAAAGMGPERGDPALLDDLTDALSWCGPRDPRMAFRFRHPIARLRCLPEHRQPGWRIAAHGRAATALRRPAARSRRRPGRTTSSARRSPGDEAAARGARAGRRAGRRARAGGRRPLARRRPAAAARYAEPAALEPARRARPCAGGDRAPGGGARHAAARRSRGSRPSRPELRVRLVAACAFCENSLGRHGAAHARLLARARGVSRRRQRGRGGAAGRALRRCALPTAISATMRRWAGKAAQTARALDDRGLLAVAEALVCFAEYNLGRSEQAEAARISSAAGLDALPDEQLTARLDLPPLPRLRGVLLRSTTTTRHGTSGAAIALARASGQGQFVGSMMVGLAQALERLGRLREAHGTAEAAVEAGRLTGNRQAIGFALVAEAWTAAELGEVEHARAAAEEARRRCWTSSTRASSRAPHSAHVGVIWLEIGEPTAASSSCGRPASRTCR